MLKLLWENGHNLKQIFTIELMNHILTCTGFCGNHDKIYCKYTFTYGVSEWLVQIRPRGEKESYLGLILLNTQLKNPIWKSYNKVYHEVIYYECQNKFH